MAGSFVKSTKKDFISASPKPKQASILNFFSNQKQTPPESYLRTADSQCGLTQEPSLERVISNELTDPSDYFESFDFINEVSSDQNSKSKRKCPEKVAFSINLKHPSASNIITPKILNELSESAGAIELDQFEPSRYSWLVDVKDSNGRKKGN